ncbi:MAG: amidohydrolase family protein, partial [Actinomycetota bacterium]
MVDEWTQRIVDNGRLEGNSDPTLRLKESERDGVAAEVLFPDFGLPFELYSPFLAAAMGFSRTPEQVDVGNRAFNRWLADFCNAAPGRFAGMASVSFHDVDAALIEIRAAREAGLHGIVLPMFDEARPVFDPAFEPIWALLEELDMPVNSHTGTSSAGAVPLVPPVPHPTCALPIFSP